MNWIIEFINLVLHLDKHLIWIFEHYGLWIYALVFLIILCETGLVIAPFLPGDSMLFALGAFAASGSLSVGWLMLILSVAAILGDTLNYWVGHHIGTRVFKKNYRWINKEHLQRTEGFYDRHGGKTIIIARFLPILRTFAPLVAGIGKMKYGRFVMYNVVGGILWVCSLLLLGYFFGSLPFVKKNFSIAILIIILLSSTPVLIEFIRHRLLRKERPDRKRKGGSFSRH
ncbi:MAG TPA: DedA family protein [Candidatus Nanoarchaeia archaeon]|nr:DedA family protein [Candidatus Nanoarchaeia archaeon]